MPCRFTRFAFGLVCLLCLAGPVRAELLVSDPGLTGAKVVDFSEFSGVSRSLNAPVDVGGLVGEEVLLSPITPFIFPHQYAGIQVLSTAFGANGQWTSAMESYVFLRNATVRFTFVGDPVLGIGGFFNYSPGLNPPLTISALSIDGLVLEQYVIPVEAPISTPGGQNAGGFRGILRQAPDIAALEVTGDYAVLDNLWFVRQPEPVPEPSAVVLCSLGVMGVFVVQLRRHRRYRGVRC